MTKLDEMVSRMFLPPLDEQNRESLKGLIKMLAVEFAFSIVLEPQNVFPDNGEREDGFNDCVYRALDNIKQSQ